MEHKSDLVKGFTNEHQVHNLVYFEETQSVEEAILREKRLKKWNRQWKIKLINRLNPTWSDLYSSITS
jgi:putative endonuclease